MAEVTDRDRLLAAGDAQAAQRIAAYRESCVAEERAARLKAEGERDGWKRDAMLGRSRIKKWEDHEVKKASCCDENEQRAIKAEARLREFEQHEAETHASLGAILGTDTSLLDGSKRMSMRLKATEAQLRATQTSRELAAEQGINILKVKLMESEARLRAVIEAADRLADGLDDSNNNHSAGCACDYHDALATYRRVRDAQASPEPEASKDAFEQQVRTLREIGASERVVAVAERAAAEATRRVRHSFEWGPDKGAFCRHCGLPWSQHGEGR